MILLFRPTRTHTQMHARTRHAPTDTHSRACLHAPTLPHITTTPSPHLALHFPTNGEKRVDLPAHVGPGNQVSGFKEAMALSRLLNRTLIVHDLLSHYLEGLGHIIPFDHVSRHGRGSQTPGCSCWAGLSCLSWVVPWCSQGGSAGARGRGAAALLGGHVLQKLPGPGRRPGLCGLMDWGTAVHMYRGDNALDRLDQHGMTRLCRAVPCRPVPCCARLGRWGPCRTQIFDLDVLRQHQQVVMLSDLLGGKAWDGKLSALVRMGYATVHLNQVGGPSSWRGAGGGRGRAGGSACRWAISSSAVVWSCSSGSKRCCRPPGWGSREVGD